MEGRKISFFNFIGEKSNNDFWVGKKVLVTGHTGFKGSWLTLWLLLMGAKVIGFSLNENDEKGIFEKANLSNKIEDLRGDIRNSNQVNEIFKKYNPDIVFHLAAQPLVRESYENPVYTYEVNVNGTINILEGIKSIKEKCVGILITTDKCYENKEQIWGYREEDSFGGYDPYSSSKACCEILISSWRNSFFNKSSYDEHKKSIASVRAGNVIGGGDFSKDRIIPDCIRALEEKKKIEIRNPNSTRPWQHVLEPLYGYMLLAEKIYNNPKEYCEGWNFGPDINSAVSVKEVAEGIADLYGVKDAVKIKENSVLHEANLLFLDTTKARVKLGWSGKLNINEALKLTVHWYKNYKNGDVFNLCKEEIEYYYKVLGGTNE